MPTDIIANGIVIGILVIIAGLIIRYLIKAKKRGDVCIGCSCGKQCSGNCGACSHEKTGEKEKNKEI